MRPFRRRRRRSYVIWPLVYGRAEQAGHLGTEAPVGEAADGMDEQAQGAGQGHDAGVPEAQGSGSLALLVRGQCDPLEELGRDGTALADTLDDKQPPVGGTGLRLDLGQVPEAPLTAEIGRAVDDRLDPQRPALLEVLLDPGVLVEEVDRNLGPAGDDLGRERPRRRALDPSIEDQGDLVGPTEVEVVGDERLEEGPSRRGASKTIVRATRPGASRVPTSSRPPGRPDRAGSAGGPSSARRSARSGLGRGGRTGPGGRPGLRSAAKPLASSVNASPAAGAWRLAHSCPFSQTLAGYGK